MTWCFPPGKLRLEINYHHSEGLQVADSSSPFLAALHSVLPGLPPPQIKAGIRDQNFLKLLSF